MLDFLSLYGCELQVVVGERNSIMGRVMTPLNKLRYQLRFIDKAEQCLPRVEKTQLRMQLEQAISQKKSALPAHLWNALWSDEPMASLLTQSKGLFPTDAKKAATSVLQADLEHTLKLVNDIQTGKLDTELDTLGEIQQRWVFGHQPGQLINSARLLTTRLNDASAMIEQRLKNKPLCYLKKPNQQARRVKGVFFQVYIGRVQPYVSDVSRKGEQIFSRLARLADLQKAQMPDSFRPFYQQVLVVDSDDSLWSDYAAAIKHHTQQWQRLLGQCGMQPMAG